MTATTGASPSPQVTPERLKAARKAVISSSIGAALEWFDIIVYASFAVVISKNFFPSDDESLGLILTFATFAISYLVRPIGGTLIGAYADKHGRKNALTLTFGLMVVGTLIMAVAPTYATVGVWGALIILLSRVIQGISAGGEFGASTTFLVETAPHRKAYYASWQVASQGASMMLASAFGYVLFKALTTEQLYTWGWRIPFFVGLLIGPVGLYIRSKLSEPEEFVTAKKESSPIRSALTEHLGRILTGIACVGLGTISVYLILYMPTYAVKSLQVPAAAAYLGGIVAGAVGLVGVPFVGRLADRVGPAKIMTFAAAAAIVVIVPLMQLVIGRPTVTSFVVVIALLGGIMAFYFGCLPAMLSDLFPQQIRGTGISIAYNVGVSSLGGIAPLVITWLIQQTGSKTAPGFYYMAVATLSLVGLYFARKVYRAR